MTLGGARPAYIMRHGKFLKNAAIISVGGLAAKAIGALYRIPLANSLGSYGMGLYQMAYPLFLVFLTFSSAGIPSAFARMISRDIARGREVRSTVRVALKLFALIGLCGGALMALFAPLMSSLQREGNLRVCYFSLAPSVFFVALIAVFRGYFQGTNDMKPTAFSEIAEQCVKCALGLFFALRYADNTPKAVACTLFSVTVSEAAALFFLFLHYRRGRTGGLLRVKKTTGAEVFSAALPVMAAAALSPLSQLVDSVLIVRLLSVYERNAVSLYGLFAGGAAALVSLPATVAAGIATAAVPSVSRCFACGNFDEGRRRALYALFLTLALAVPCALGLFFLAKPIAGLLYPSLSAGDGARLVSLIRVMSVSAVTLSGVDTLAACLTGMGRAGKAALAMSVAVAVKFFLQLLLVRNETLSVLGAAIAANACYLVAFFLDLFYTVKKKREKRHDYDYLSGYGTGRDHVGCAGGAQCRKTGDRAQLFTRRGGALD